MVDDRQAFFGEATGCGPGLGRFQTKPHSEQRNQARSLTFVANSSGSTKADPHSGQGCDFIERLPECSRGASRRPPGAPHQEHLNRRVEADGCRGRDATLRTLHGGAAVRIAKVGPQLWRLLRGPRKKLRQWRWLRVAPGVPAHETMQPFEQIVFAAERKSFNQLGAAPVARRQRHG